MDVTVRVDVSDLVKLRTDLPKKKREFLMAVANETADHIKMNWSPVSPSSPGERPAIDTGDLNRSVEARMVDEARPASGIYMLLYWMFLEYGTIKMAPRPFVWLSVMAVIGRIKAAAKEVVTP